MERVVSAFSDQLTTILSNVSALKDREREKESSLRNDINEFASKLDNVTSMCHSAVRKLSEEIKQKDEETKKSLELVKQQTNNLTRMVDRREEAAAPKTCDHGNYTLLPSVNMCIRLSGPTDTLSWYVSQGRCESEAGRLVNLDSVDKQDAVVKYLHSIGDKAYDAGKSYRIWVGMKKIQGRSFEWTEHGNTNGLKWDDGEPDALDYQDVVQLTPGGLSDIPSYSKRRYICEIVLA
ncbi:uncharacterized protein LOC124258380 [Haliotis rubra]|uniref:uncharacterized protein LOC124258380 n=1 Tax=Haliotis rubra TaxID=36100 RepID=UPI001EE60D0F|nr:uncharacterized protein LOC124258380 [Haliotis rubra]